VIRALLVALLVAAVSATPASAQDELASMFDTLAAFWARGDATALAGFAASRGIELELHGESLGRISGRKAAAAFRHLFATQETIAVRASMTSRVHGADRTAFGELTWELRPRGSMVPASNTVFFGLVREGTSWKISQIRVRR
jgi:hypothetical protein